MGLPALRQTLGQKSDNAVSVVTITAPPNTVAGDLVIAHLGTWRGYSGVDDAQAVQGDLVIVRAAGPAGDGAIGPTAWVVYWRATTGGSETRSMTMSAATPWGGRAYAYEGDTVDWGDLVVVTGNYPGQVQNTYIPNPSIPAGWTPAGDPTAQVVALGLATHRANVPLANANTGWDGNVGGNTAGPATWEGLRSRFGTGSGTYGAGGSHTMANYNGMTGAAYIATAGVLVQGLRTPLPAFQADQSPADLSVTFDPSATLRYVPPGGYDWDFGDGSTASGVDAPTHVYVAPGQYTVRLTATNGAGSAFVDLVVDVTAPPPIAAFTYVNIGGSLEVVFTDASERADTYAWDFGDGNTSTEASPVHTYAQGGTYTVALTVTNAAGQDTAQQSISVVLGSPPPERPDGVVLDVQVELGTTWESLYCDLAGASWAWGASEDAGYLTVGAPQQLRAVLVDPARRFDPGNASSPDFGLLRTGRQVRVLFGTDIAYQGRLVDIVHDLTFASLTVDDVIAQLGVVDVDTDGPLSLPDAQGASDRIAALAALAGWPTALSDLETDATPLLGSELAERTVWEALVETAQATLGVLATSQAGHLVYRTRASAWAPGDPLVVVGCDLPDGTPADVGTDDIAMASGANRIRNVVSAHRKGTDDPPVVAFDQASIDDYGKRTATADLVVRNQGDLTTWVDLVLGNLKQPAYGGRAVRFVLRDAALAARVVQARFGDLWRLYDTHHGAPIDLTGRLAGLAYEVTASTISVVATLYEDPGLAPAARQSVLDTPAELASGTLENLDPSSGVAVLDHVAP